MSFFEERMNRFAQRNNPQPIKINTVSISQPVNIPNIPDVIKAPKQKKAKFKIAEDKDQIILDIIEEKPPLADVRKALIAFAMIAEDEYNEED